MNVRALPYINRQPRNAKLLARVGFWRAQIEMLLLGIVVTSITYLLGPLLGSPWTELLTYPLMAFYVLPAWRLDAGRGGLARRALRVLAWGVLYALLAGLLDWLTLTFIPYTERVYGMRAEALQVSAPAFMLGKLLITLSLFLPARILITLWHAGRSRLRWSLTFSYLLIGLLTTMLVPFTLSILIAISSLAIMPPGARPDIAAQRLAIHLAPLMRQGLPADQLGSLLHGLLDGSAQLPLGPDGRVPSSELIPAFNGIQRMTVLSADGAVLASAGEEPYLLAMPLPSAEAARLALVLGQARVDGCATGRPADGPIPDSAACTMTDERGAPLAIVLVEKGVDVQTQWATAVGRVISIVALNTSVIVTIVLIVVLMVLVLALVIGYLLARHMTRRLERLTAATAGLSAGNLDRRVEVDSADEIGRLSTNFNTMATRLAERERALAAEAARSEALLRANRRLVADVSHELRTPLATLRGYIEALEQRYANCIPAHDMEVIQGEVRRLTALIDDLFTLARAEAQQLPLTIEVVNAGDLARRLTDMIAPLSRRERQIELVAILPDHLPPIMADRARLEQVLLNLVQNALRHTPPGGIVAIEAAAGDDMVALTVADTGVGIPDDELPLVFDRFYRGDSSRARETGGAGLGLALVRELVQAMGGTVVAESAPGRGSRFTVTLRQASIAQPSAVAM